MNPFLSGASQAAASPRSARGQAMRTFYRAARLVALASSMTFAAGVGAAPIDANTASPAQLESIKGIGPRTATLIVSERERSGPFLSMQDFTDRIRGIGPRKAEALQAAGLTIAPRSAAPSPGAPGTNATREARR